MTLVVVSGWLAAVIFVSVGSRQEVLALARPVEQFQELNVDDLRVVRVAADPDLSMVSADQLSEVVGRAAATNLIEGSLLHQDALLDVGERVVGSTEAVVGTVLAAVDSPANLRASAAVEVVVRAPAGSAAGPATLRGWVLEVGDAETPGVDSRRVSLVVPSDSVAMVSAAAAEDRVSVAVLGGE